MDQSLASTAPSGPAPLRRPGALARAGNWLEAWMPRIALSPSIAIMLLFIYGYMLWTVVLSLTPSRLLPRYEYAGLSQYVALFANERWWLAMKNLLVFGSLFVGICLLVGVLLAIFLDQKVRAEGAIRAIYMYPMALSFIVTGTAWRWMLNPDLGLQRVVRDLGWTSFSFDWLVDPDRAIYTVVIAAVWQSSGFVMALFLAGLRGIDESVIHAARVDGASMPMIYRRIILPSLRPVFFSSLMILMHIAIKSFDLVVALTNGGPGLSTDLPAVFMYAFAFTRNQIGLGAASAVMMLATVAAVLVPLIYSELRRPAHG